MSSKTKEPHFDEFGYCLNDRTKFFVQGNSSTCWAYSTSFKINTLHLETFETFVVKTGKWREYITFLGQDPDDGGCSAASSTIGEWQGGNLGDSEKRTRIVPYLNIQDIQGSLIPIFDEKLSVSNHPKTRITPKLMPQDIKNSTIHDAGIGERKLSMLSLDNQPLRLPLRIKSEVAKAKKEMAENPKLITGLKKCGDIFAILKVDEIREDELQKDDVIGIFWKEMKEDGQTTEDGHFVSFQDFSSQKLDKDSAQKLKRILCEHDGCEKSNGRYVEEQKLSSEEILSKKIKILNCRNTGYIFRDSYIGDMCGSIGKIYCHKLGQRYLWPLREKEKKDESSGSAIKNVLSSLFSSSDKKDNLIDINYKYYRIDWEILQIKIVNDDETMVLLPDGEIEYGSEIEKN